MGIMTASNPQPPAACRSWRPSCRALIRCPRWSDLRVFGSVLHGTAANQSDVDLLVDFPGSPSFEQYMDLKLALKICSTLGWIWSPGADLSPRNIRQRHEQGPFRLPEQHQVATATLFS